MRRNVWIPDDLDQLLRDRYPDANLSEIVQRAVSELIGCQHAEVSCTCCGTRLRADDLGRDAAGSLWRDAWTRLAGQIAAGATLVGYGRVLRQVGIDHGVIRALEAVEPRRSRAAERAAGDARAVG